MLSAIEEARRTVPTFIGEVERPSPGTRGHAFKMKFSDGDRNEHMWINMVKFERGRLTGRLANVPDEIKDRSEGSTVECPPQEISDWMFIRNDVLVGGYTVRVLYNRYSNEERIKADATFDFMIR